jgi:hypothetical protein
LWVKKAWWLPCAFVLVERPGDHAEPPRFRLLPACRYLARRYLAHIVVPALAPVLLAGCSSSAPTTPALSDEALKAVIDDPG